MHDTTRIFVKAGNGGGGAASFRREKFVPMGGPDGGDGGRGGSVVLRVDPNLSTLLPFAYKQHFRAQHGQPGRGVNKHGKQGEDLYIAVPPGVVVIDDESGEPIVDLTEPDQEFTIVKGGRGGLGNSHFVTSTRQAPRIAELGEPGEERWIRLELKLIADVGLVGLPNAGKSTLLAASSAARPKIADYPFTTLEPNLGVVEIGGAGGETFVVADIPGLIEGAAEGAGLGHEFLRHVERTRLLVHVIDGSGGLEERDPVADFHLIAEELAAYASELSEKPMFLAINKLDLPETRENLARLHQQLDPEVERVFEVSGVTGDGMREMLTAIAERLREIPRPETSSAEQEERVYRLADVDESHWEAQQLSRHHFVVSGVKLERYLKMTDFRNEEAAERFQSILESSGVSRRLETMGIEPGDIVHIAGAELIWDEDTLEAEQMAEAGKRRRRTHRQRLIDTFGEVNEKKHS
jgi:GTP-binding protein